MRNILKRIVLVLTGLGLLTSTGVSDAPKKLHDEVRHRVFNELNFDSGDPDLLREALLGDPHFDLLLEYYLQRSVDANHGSHPAFDAVQEAMVKIWKRKPHLFLEPHEDVVRYLRVATRHNIVSEIRKTALVKAGTKERLPDPEELLQERNPDPAEEAAARDLLERLVSGLDGRDRPVLDACLKGKRSSREIAGHLGISRYAAGQSRDRIRRLLGLEFERFRQ